MSRQPVLRIEVRGPNAIQRAGGNPVLDTLERGLTGDDLVLSLTGLTYTPDDIARLTRHYLEHPEDRPALETTVEGAWAHVTLPDAD
jgi:hypothetical protein